MEESEEDPSFMYAQLDFNYHGTPSPIVPVLSPALGNNLNLGIHSLVTSYVSVGLGTRLGLGISTCARVQDVSAPISNARVSASIQPINLDSGSITPSTTTMFHASTFQQGESSTTIRVSQQSASIPHTSMVPSRSHVALSH